MKILTLAAVLFAASFAHANPVVVPWLTGTFADHEYEITSISPDGKLGFDIKAAFEEPEPFNNELLGRIFDEKTLATKHTFAGLFTSGGTIKNPEGEFEFAGHWSNGLVTIGSGIGDGDKDDQGEAAIMSITTYSPEPSTLLMLGSGLLSCTWLIRSRRAAYARKDQ